MKKVIGVENSSAVALDGMLVVAGVVAMVKTDSIAMAMSSHALGPQMKTKAKTIENGTQAKYYIPSGNRVIDTETLYNQSKTSSLEFDGQKVDEFVIEVVRKSLAPKLFYKRTFKELQGEELMGAITQQASEAVITDIDTNYYAAMKRGLDNHFKGVADYQGRPVVAYPGCFETISAADIKDRTKTDEILDKLDDLVIELRTRITIINQRNISKDRLVILATPRIKNIWKNKLTSLGSGAGKEGLMAGYKGKYDDIDVLEANDALPDGIHLFVTVKGMTKSPFHSIEMDAGKRDLNIFDYLTMHWRRGAETVIPEHIYGMGTTAPVIKKKTVKK